MRLLRTISSLPAKHWLLVSILLVATFVRFFNLKNSLLFAGDQGRDALIVSNIFINKDPVFIGPVTSVGNMYLGPLYYYFMMPFLWLSYPSPMGPVYAVAAVGVLTVFLMYYLGRSLIGEKAALLGAALYALSAVVVQYTRFSWNPNPAPLVTLIMMYWTYRAWKHDARYWLGVALCVSVIMQLHYLALLSAAGAGLIWLAQVFSLVRAPKSKKSTDHHTDRWRKLIIGTGVGAAIFVASLTPLMLFDAKHDWLNAKAFQKLFTKEQSFKVSDELPVSGKISKTVKETHGRAMHILFEYNIGKNRSLNSALVAVVGGWMIWRLTSSNRSATWHGEIVVASFLVTGIVGTAVYNHTIFDHYIAYLFPVTFLVYGTILAWLSQRKLGGLVSLGLAAGFLWYNLPRMPLHTNTWTIDDMKGVSDSIAERLKPGEKYNIVLLSESRDLYGQNYRYFLSTTANKPLPPEQSPLADTLVIIDEEKKNTQLGDLNIHEIAIFPNKEPDLVYSIPNGPVITFLRKQPQP